MAEENEVYETIHPFVSIIAIGVVMYVMYRMKKNRKKNILKSYNLISEPSFSVLDVRWTGLNVTFLLVFKDEQIFFIRPDKINSEIKNQSLDELLKTDKDNFKISFHEISKIELSKSSIGVNGERAGKLIIHASKKFQFDIPEVESFAKGSVILQKLFQNKFVEK